MKKILVLFVMTLAFNSYAKTCTTESKKSGKWMSAESVKAMYREKGYKLKIFKEEGSCFEIYGWDSTGKKVELYIDPTDGSVVE